MAEERTIGEVLRQLREDRSKLLREVASDPRVDMDPTLLSHIERGRRVPTPPQLEGLAAYYDVPVDDLAPYVQTALTLRATRSWTNRSERPSADRTASRVQRSSDSDLPAMERACLIRAHSDFNEVNMFLIAPEASLPSRPLEPEPAERPSLAESIGQARSSAEMPVDELAESARRAIDTLERLAEDKRSPAGRRAAKALEWLRDDS
jgi:transcriptional regulator with XRE-family HTH domain